MTELEVMRRAKMYMDKLAMGVDPISDQRIPADSALNQARLARCFAYVSEVLGKVIENGGNIGGSARVLPFSITPQQLAMVQLSREPVRISQLVEFVMAAVNDPRMKKPSTTFISNWLVAQGFLEKQVTAEGKNIRVPTAAGMAMGISSQTRTGRDGEYHAVYYNLNAQRMILDHLTEILGPRNP